MQGTGGPLALFTMSRGEMSALLLSPYLGIMTAEAQNGEELPPFSTWVHSLGLC